MNKEKLKKVIDTIESNGVLEYLVFRPDLETLEVISGVSKDNLVLAIDVLKRIEYGLDEAEQELYDGEDDV
jgi:hypothetical protein